MAFTSPFQKSSTAFHARRVVGPRSGTQTSIAMSVFGLEILEEPDHHKGDGFVGSLV